MEKKIRVLMAKAGLDGHDRGAKLIVRALRDAGVETIYTGIHQTPPQIVASAIQEDVDVIGVSILSGAHLPLMQKVMNLLKEEGVADQLLVLVGGVIPKEDIPKLKAMGVAEVFPVGSPVDKIVEFIKTHVEDKPSKGGS